MIPLSGSIPFFLIVCIKNKGKGKVVQEKLPARTLNQ
jgi:hypothetical protein